MCVQNVVMVDCRSVFDYNASHITGAINVSCSNFMRQRLQLNTVRRQLTHNDHLFAYLRNRRSDVFFLFLSVFFHSPQNTRQPFSEMAERISMKLLPNDSWENGVSNVLPKWGLGPQIILLGLKTEIVRTGVAASRTTQN